MKTKPCPSDKKKTARVLVAGPLADEDNFMISRYGPNDLPTVTVLDGIRQLPGRRRRGALCQGLRRGGRRLPRFGADRDAPHGRRAGRHRRGGETGRRLRRDRRRAGRGRRARGESHSRTSLELPGRQAAVARGAPRHGRPRGAGAHQRATADRQLGGAKRPGHPRRMVPLGRGRHSHCRNPLRRLQPGRQAHDHLPAEHRTDRAELPLQEGFPRRTAPQGSQRRRRHPRAGVDLPLRLRPELHDVRL